MYTYYQFDITLAEARPRIWRRFLLRQEASFHELHLAIQESAGWQNYHLFAFRKAPIGPALAGIPDPDPFEGESDPDAKKVKLASYFSSHDRCLYEYDFGDGWLHEVQLVKTVELPYQFKRALLDGARSFPPEDCGGLGGYERCVHFVETGVDEWEDDPESLREWLNGWTPDGFVLDQVKPKFDK